MMPASPPTEPRYIVKDEPGEHFCRVTDTNTDTNMCRCFNPTHAKRIADALNSCSSGEPRGQQGGNVDGVMPEHDMEGDPEPDGSQAPIVRVRVEQRGTTVASGGKLPHYMIVHQSMYAPGLPPGEHDLYCV